MSNNRSEPPEREGVYWGSNRRDIEGMTIVGRVGNPHGIVKDNHVVAWVIQNLTQYLDSRPTNSIEIPEYYKDFNTENIIRSDYTDETGQLGIPVSRVLTGLKTLCGGGHFNSNEYVLIDCSPVPILKGPEGAIAIAPVHFRDS